MRTLTPQEQRTIRLASIGVGIYLALFFGFRLVSYVNSSRAHYRQLTQEAEKLSLKLQQYRDKADIAGQLMDDFHLDPARLDRAKVVSDASRAIQQAAMSGGIRLGPVREAGNQPQARELTTIQLEGSGPVPALLTFVQRINRLGYPLVVDSLQFSSDPRQPGGLKVNLTIIVLDFDQWKSEEVPHA